MKRLAIGVLAVFALLVAGLLVAPSFIDWTNYRDTFESQLENATGRAVAIEGDVALALLPRPAIQVGDVRIANPPGATSADFAQAERVAVNLAFGPLLSGRLQFTSIEVQRPVISAEILEDGSSTWALSPSRVETSPAGRASGDDAAFDLGIDNLSVTEGKVRFRDSRSGTAQDITNITLDLTAGSVAGPFDVTGELQLSEKTWQLDASVGQLRDSRPSTIAVDLMNPDAGLSVEFSGTVSLAEKGPEISGRVSSFGENLSGVLVGFDLVEADQPLPAEMNQDFRLEARIDVQDSSITSDSIEMRVGTTTANGVGKYSWSEEQEFALSLSAARFNLDAWQFTSIEPLTRFANVLPAFPVSKAEAQQPGADFSLPSNITGTLNLGINLIEWRGQLMRNARINATLENAELTLVDAGVDLPGSTAIQLSGFVSAGNGTPVFDLTSDVSSRDFRTLLDFLDAAPPPDLVSPSRLNSMSVTAQVKGNAERLAFDPLKVVLDTTQLNGTAALETATFKTQLDLSVSALDLDSYLPALQQQFSSDEGTVSEGDAGQDSSSGAGGAGGAFSGMDADLKLEVGALTVGGNVYRSVSVDLSAVEDGLVIRDATVGDFAGAKFSVAGEVADTFSQPRAKDVKVSLVTQDFSRVSRTLGLELPRLGVLEGAVTLQGTLSGDFSGAEIDVTAMAGGITATAAGNLQNLSASLSYDLAATLAHDEYVTMATNLGVALPSNTLSQGEVNVTAQIKGATQSIQVTDLRVQVGTHSLSGTIGYESSATRPRLMGSVDIANANFDLLLPPDPTEQFARTSRGRSSRNGSAVSARWSADPIDLSVLSGIDAEVMVTARQLRVRGLDFDELTAALTLSSGTLTIPAWTGTLFGGPATGDLILMAGSPLQLQAALSVSGAALDRVGGALAGSAQASGKADIQGRFSAAGQNQRELVESLAGQGRVVATGIDASSSGQGFAMTAVLAPVRALSQLGGVFSGGVTQGLASMGTDFAGERGVFTLSNATLQSNVYSGAFTGTIDLPRWWINADGQVRLEVNLITQLLGNRLQMPSLIPVSINGPLDLPNVNMDTSGGAAAAQPETQPAPTQMQPSQQEPPQPIDVLQGIFNEITKPR